jgi:glycosyltransferase involved in cell wall biosynthesis
MGEELIFGTGNLSLSNLCFALSNFFRLFIIHSSFYFYLSSFRDITIFVKNRNMVKISVVIITLNEEKNIERCLSSVKEIADEIVVLDSFSTDRTKEICEQYGVKFYEQTFAGYVAQKNDVIKLASSDYVLSLDADEALSPELLKSITEVKQNWDADAYTFNRLNNYCGKWIKHSGWYPDRKIRLFDRRLGEWTGEKVHEKLEVKPSAKQKHLIGDLLHYTFYTIDQHVHTQNKYSGYSAEELLKRGKRISWIKITFNPFWKFIRSYFFQGGFRDGFPGFVVCINTAYTTFLKYSKAKMMMDQAKQEQKSK